MSGNITVKGTTTTIDSTTMIVADPNIVLNETNGLSSGDPDGGGITLRSSNDTDKTFDWRSSSSSWTSSENIDLSVNKNYRINNSLFADSNGVYSPAFYLGQPNQTNTWRIVVDSVTNALQFQLFNGTNWIIKSNLL